MILEQGDIKESKRLSCCLKFSSQKLLNVTDTAVDGGMTKRCKNGSATSIVTVNGIGYVTLPD